MEPPEPPLATVVICALGMHRSGTSLVARILNLLGVDLGTHQSLARPGEDNPKGYWEHPPLSLLNDEILARFDGRWDVPPAFPAGWPGDPRVADLRAKARHLLARDFAAAPLWGWKDPRSCLTLPFWQQLIGPMRYVICVRNPCAVVASLGRRSTMSAARAERLWLGYVQASLAHTSGQPRLFVFYEELLADCRPALRQMAALVGHPERADDPRVLASVAEFLEPDLCHHRMSIEDVAGDRRLSFATRSLYLAVRAHARLEAGSGGEPGEDQAGSLGQRALDLLAAQAVTAADLTTTMAAERDSLLRDHHKRMATLTAERAAVVAALNAEREATVAALNTERAAVVATLAAERDTVAALGGERDRLVTEVRTLAAQAAHLAVEAQESAARELRLLASAASLEADLRRVSIERDERVRSLDALAAMIQEIHASFGWRLIAFSRRLLVALLPAGTRRRKIFHRGVWRLTRRPPPPGARRDVVDLHHG